MGVLAVAIYSVPLMDRGTLTAFGASPFEIPFVATAMIAAFYGLQTITDRHERRFWSYLGAACVFWLAALLVIATVPDERWTVAHDIGVDAVYLLFYAPILLAAELMPHLRRPADRRETERWLRWAGLTALVVGWFGYFVVVPVVYDHDFYATMLPSSLLFITIDLVMLVRFSLLAFSCGSPRWRVLYGALAVTAAAILATDALDALVAAGMLPLVDGSITDLIWAAPPFALVVVFRLRYLDLPRHADGLVGREEESRDLDPVRVGSFLVASAFSFPLVHYALHSMHTFGNGLEWAHHLVVFLALVLLGSLAVAAFRMLERERITAFNVRAALDDRLRQAKKMEAVGRLASVMTQEYLNTLSAVGGYVDLTLDDVGPEHRASVNLRRAHDVVGRMTAFTRQLLVLSRGRPVRAEVLALNQALMDLMPDIRAIVSSPRVVDTHLGADAGHVGISASYLREVVMHLSANARDAMPDAGTLTIETSSVEIDPDAAMPLAIRPGRYGKLVVKDEGIGIPNDVLAHLFEPFYTTKVTEKHVGLGLSTVYGVVTQHGGCITVASAPGAGSTFEMLIPAAQRGREVFRGDQPGADTFVSTRPLTIL